MSHSTASRFLVIAALVGCGVVAAFVIVRVWSSSSDSVSLTAVNPAWVMLSSVCMCGAVGTYAVCWWLMMRSLEGRAIEAGPALRLFLMGWPGRYVPGSVPHYGARLLAGPRAGMTRAAVAASLAYENLFAVATSGVLAMLLLLVGFRTEITGSRWAIAAAVFASLSLCALHPAVVRAGIRLAARRIHRLRVLEDHVLPASAVIGIGAAYMAAALLAGLSLYAAVRAVAPDADSPLLLTIACYNLAGIAGVLALAVPSGIGVREGVVVALIGAAVSAPVALAAAVLVRLIAIAVDFTPMLLIVGWGAVGRARRWRRIEPARQAHLP